jgi:hypothetical protein
MMFGFSGLPPSGVEVYAHDERSIPAIMVRRAFTLPLGIKAIYHTSPSDNADTNTVVIRVYQKPVE